MDGLNRSQQIFAAALVAVLAAMVFLLMSVSGGTILSTHDCPIPHPSLVLPAGCPSQ